MKEVKDTKKDDLKDKIAGLYEDDNLNFYSGDNPPLAGFLIKYVLMVLALAAVVFLVIWILRKPDNEEVLASEQNVHELAVKQLGAPGEEVVTAKDVTNLRDIPSQGEDSNIMATLQNGETATRIGISNTGWSKLEYNGEIYYAVSSLLTTDLTVKPAEPEPEPDDGIQTVFTACNDRVSPKIEVNLRLLPSVTNPDATVVVTLQYGEVVTRTGINTDLGWSRVEYNGQTLYCISSYVYVVEE